MVNLLRLFCGLSLFYSYVAHAQTFVDVAPEAGVDYDGISAGAAWGDYDGDGDPDLHVSAGFAGESRLYDNHRGIFTEVSAVVGIDDEAPAYGAVWGDYDNDGDLDLYVTRGQPDGEVPNSLYKNNGDGTMSHEEQRAGVDDGAFSLQASWADYDRDGFIDLFVTNNPTQNEDEPSRLYNNNGDGTFTDVFPEMGFTAWGAGAAWGDYDNDGDADLMMPSFWDGIEEIEIEGMNISRLYRNDGATFSEVSALAGIDSSGSAVGPAWADFDNDMDLDLFIVTNAGFDGRPTFNRFYRNENDGTFSNIAEEAGVGDRKDFGFGNMGTWADYDADGFIDIYVTYTGSNPNRLFHNQGDGSFIDVASELGVDNPDGWGAAWADYDEDGDLDLFVANFAFEDDSPIGAPDRLYRNDLVTGRWLAVELEGVISNVSAIGTRVVAVDGTRRQMREVDGGSGLYSQGDLAVELGFGSAAVVDSLLIFWPSGVEQVLTDVATNQRLLVKEGDDTPTAVEEVGESVPETFALEQNYPNPFNSGTMIDFSVAELGEVELSVFNLVGQQVRNLVSGVYGPGQFRVDWDGRDSTGQEVASGVYTYRLNTGAVVKARRMTLLR